MPYKEKEIVKVRYSIGAAAKICKVYTSAIRLWEQRLPFLKPKRRVNENRYYTIKELEKLKKVSFLRKSGVSIKAIREAWNKQYFNQYVEFIEKSRNEDKIKKKL